MRGTAELWHRQYWAADQIRGQEPTASLQKKVCDPQLFADQIEHLNNDYTRNKEFGRVSRLYKFDWQDNWLLICDEAHKYAMGLKQVGHIIEWFEQNPNHRRSGITATPKRSDGVSIGHKLFPGIALDFSYTRAVREGYAVPFLNKFVLVEGVDFAEFKSCKKQDEIDEKFAEQVQTEEALARLCDPMLDLAEGRRTIIFSATVSMAQHTADYINARSRCLCQICQSLHWYPTLTIGDGAVCRECGATLDVEGVMKCGSSAHFMDGETPHVERQRILREYRSGDVQFLSVCGLCKEGFNDPPTSCVVVFRPVSKKASSLAEQMKGRGSRPLAGIIEGLATADERKQAIANSAKPDCLVVDLVGITGLATAPRPYKSTRRALRTRSWREPKRSRWLAACLIRLSVWHRRSAKQTKKPDAAERRRRPKCAAAKRPNSVRSWTHAPATKPTSSGTTAAPSATSATWPPRGR